jgi:DnaJ-class molecular chaperone
MSQVADLYKVLGIPEDADADAIKKAFRRLAKDFHPDTHPGDKKAEERFKEISQAYEILSDPEKRRRYDAMRSSPFGGNGGPQGGGPYYSGQAGASPFGGGSINDIFEMFFGRGASPFGGGRGGFGGFGGFGGDVEEATGRDLESEVWASFEDAALGRPITFTLQGQSQPLRLNLPAGAESGLRLRLAGQGAPGPGGRGDLYLTLKVRPSSLYRREGLDVIAPLKLNLAQALLGAQVEAPTLAGPVRLKVPAGSQPGTRLRLKGKGISTPAGTGDHFAEIQVSLPGDLDEAEAEALRAMARKRGWEL